MQASHIPGAVLIIVKDGRVYTSRAWGLSDTRARTPVSVDRTIFRVGSVSKVVTATALMQQVDRGRLKLDDDVNRYLADWKVPATFASPVRVSDLLTHTAGLDEIAPGRKVFREAAVIPLGDFLRNRIVPRRPPGTISSYNTYGISLAGHLVEVTSGLKLAAYLERDVFQPLGMTSSTLGAPLKSSAADVAVGYSSSGGKYQPEPWEYFHTSPASDVNVTAADMAKFMIAHLDGQSSTRILSDSARTSMHAVRFRNDPRILGVTYGFFEQRFHGYRALYHGGTMGGFKASLWLWPEQRMGLFLAYNREIDDLERRVLNRFAARALLPALDTADAEGVVWRKPRVRDDLRRFAGRYQLDDWCHTCTGERGYQPPPFDVKLLNDSTISFWGGQWAQVEPMLFRLMNGQLDFGQLYVAFRGDSAGRIIGLATGGPWWNERIGATASAASTTSINISSGTLDRYIGRYSLPPFGVVSIGRDEAGLYADVPGQSRVRLTPRSNTQFAITALNAEVIFKRRWWQSKARRIIVKRPGQPDLTGERM